MDPWSFAGSLALGALGAGGQMQTNRANKQMAREQMRFQERMSSTAAQRSVADFRAAGLNPALAYGTTASSPGGSSAQMGDVAEAGISTAQRGREVAAQMKLVHEQTRAAKAAADVANGPGVVRAQQTALRKEADSRADLAGIMLGNAHRDARFQEAMQPVQLRLSELDEMMKRYSWQGLTRAAASRILPWLASNVPSGLKPGRGPSMKFEAALPSRNPPLGGGGW